MARKCSVCNLEEHLPAINDRLRQGESIAELAREFQCSEDAMTRHRDNHVRGAVIPLDLEKRLLTIWARTDEMYKHALSVGSVKGAVDALTRLTDIVERLADLEAKRTSQFESQTIPEKVAAIMADPQLCTGLYDYSIKLLDQMQADAAERDRVQRERERICRVQPVENTAQPSHNLN